MVALLRFRRLAIQQTWCRPQPRWPQRATSTILPDQSPPAAPPSSFASSSSSRAFSSSPRQLEKAALKSGPALDDSRISSQGHQPLHQPLRPRITKLDATAHAQSRSLRRTPRGDVPSHGSTSNVAGPSSMRKAQPVDAETEERIIDQLHIQLSTLPGDRALNHDDVTFKLYYSLSPTTRRSLGPVTLREILKHVIPDEENSTAEYYRAGRAERRERLKFVARRMEARTRMVIHDINNVDDAGWEEYGLTMDRLGKLGASAVVEAIAREVTAVTRRMRLRKRSGMTPSSREEEEEEPGRFPPLILPYDPHTTQLLHLRLSALIRELTTFAAPQQRGHIPLSMSGRDPRFPSRRQDDIITALWDIIRSYNPKKSVHLSPYSISLLVRCVNLCQVNFTSSKYIKPLRTLVEEILVKGYGLDMRYYTVTVVEESRREYAKLDNKALNALLDSLGSRGEVWRMIMAFEMIIGRNRVDFGRTAAVREDEAVPMMASSDDPMLSRDPDLPDLENIPAERVDLIVEARPSTTIPPRGARDEDPDEEEIPTLSSTTAAADAERKEMDWRGRPRKVQREAASSATASKTSSSAPQTAKNASFFTPTLQPVPADLTRLESPRSAILSNTNDSADKLLPYGSFFPPALTPYELAQHLLDTSYTPLARDKGRRNAERLADNMTFYIMMRYATEQGDVDVMMHVLRTWWGMAAEAQGIFLQRTLILRSYQIEKQNRERGTAGALIQATNVMVGVQGGKGAKGALSAHQDEPATNPSPKAPSSTTGPSVPEWIAMLDAPSVHFSYRILETAHWMLRTAIDADPSRNYGKELATLNDLMETASERLWQEFRLLSGRVPEETVEQFNQPASNTAVQYTRPEADARGIETTIDEFPIRKTPRPFKSWPPHIRPPGSLQSPKRFHPALHLHQLNHTRSKLNALLEHSKAQQAIVRERRQRYESRRRTATTDIPLVREADEVVEVEVVVDR